MPLTKQFQILFGFFQIKMIEFFSNKMNAILYILSIIIRILAFGYMALFVMKFSNFPAKFLQGAPNYLSFILIAQLVDVIILSAEGSISRIILSRDFANLFITPCSLPLIIIASNSWKFIFILLNTCFLLLIGILGFGMTFYLNIGVIIVFITGIILLTAIDLGATGFKIVTKSNSDPINWLIGVSSILLSGTLFPVEFLPPWIRWLSKLHPQYYINTLARQTLGANTPINQLWNEMQGFILTATLFFVIGLLIFRWGFKKARIDGTIGHV